MNAVANLGVGLAVPGRWVQREDVDGSTDGSWLRSLELGHVLVTDHWCREPHEPAGSGDGLAPIVTAALAVGRPPFQLLTEMDIDRYLPAHIARYAANLWQLTESRWSLLLRVGDQVCDERRGLSPAGADLSDVIHTIRSLWSGTVSSPSSQAPSGRQLARPRPAPGDQPPIIIEVPGPDRAAVGALPDVEWVIASPGQRVDASPGSRRLLRCEVDHDATPSDLADQVRSAQADAVTVYVPPVDRSEGAALFQRVAPALRQALIESGRGHP